MLVGIMLLSSPVRVDEVVGTMADVIPVLSVVDDVSATTML